MPDTIAALGQHADEDAAGPSRVTRSDAETEAVEARAIPGDPVEHQTEVVRPR